LPDEVTARGWRSVLGAAKGVCAFAVAPASGLDALEALSKLAVHEALFREYLPVRLDDPRRDSRPLTTPRLRERLAELARSDDLSRVLSSGLREIR
jgi:hypothetical protein